MDAYRARARVQWTKVGDEYVPEVRDVIVTGVAVIPGRHSPETGDIPAEVRYLLIRQDDGTHLDVDQSALVCTEPAYLAPKPVDGEHEHDWDPVAKPRMEGSRIAGMVRTCRYPGCEAVMAVPKNPLGR